MIDRGRARKRTPSAALFAMPENGHFQRLRPLISDLVRRGIDAHVFTDRRFERDVEQAGGRFVDLFATYPLEAADDESVPIPCRYVSFAGRYAEDILADLEELGPSLIVYDTFAVIGHVVGRQLGLPYVNVCSGHNREPAQALTMREAYTRVSISSSCRRAVETLRERYGIEGASPFSYASGRSPHLNLYCEPAAYLTEAGRRSFEPLAFYGSLPSVEEIETRREDGGRRCFGRGGKERRVYVSFGTVVWRYWASEALEALGTISAALAKMSDARGLISLGGTEPGAKAVGRLTKTNVSVARYVDQWRVLQQADAFVTHHGLNSTHEAIFNLVPMVSYPFFADQPLLAERCRELGVAIPLSDSPRGPVSEEAVAAALEQLAARRESIHARLTEAREWEREVIAARGPVVERIVDLISQ